MPPIHAILDCTLDRWSPQIGDPTLMGWVTVAAYGVAAIAGYLCWQRTRRAKWHPLIQKEYGFWLLFLLFYLGLGLNKQLDLQSAMTAAGRCVSQLEGWYDERRDFQIRFVIFMAATSLLAGLIALFWFRPVLGRIWISMAGITLTICFVLVRSVGFHDFDAIINYSINDIRLNWVLELAGIALAFIGALLAWRRLGRSVAFVAAQQFRERDR